MSCLWCRLGFRRDATRPNRPNQDETPRGSPQIATRHDRIDATESTGRDTTESTESTRRIDRIRTKRQEKVRKSRRDTTESGDPPTPFSVGRAVLDPRSLNFFALHCAFLQKSCKKEGVLSIFLPSTALFYKSLVKSGGRAKKVILFHRKVILFHRKVREKSEKSQRKVREKSEKSHNNVIIMS